MPSLQTQAMTTRLLKAEHDKAKARRNGRKEYQPRVLPMERDTAVLWGMLHG